MLPIGTIAPDFTADTTQGKIHFHEWIEGKWAVLFSHPKDFTPVCTTELGAVARLKGEFDKRGVKVIGLSVDPVADHVRWEKDIEETQGVAVNFPMIADSDLSIAKAYGMLPATAGTSAGRTPADNQTVRTVFVIGPDKAIKRPGSPTQPDHQAQLRRDPARHRLAATDGEDESVDPGRLEAGRRRHHRGLGQRRSRQDPFPPRLEVAQALYSRRQTVGNPSRVDLV